MNKRFKVGKNQRTSDTRQLTGYMMQCFINLLIYLYWYVFYEYKFKYTDLFRMRSGISGIAVTNKFNP